MRKPGFRARSARRAWTTGLHRRGPLGYEQLESRQLLAIAWINQGTGTNDSDGFNAAFSGNAAAARAVVNQAIADWQAVLPGYNYSLTVSAGGLAPPTLASTTDISTNQFEQPISGTITVGAGVNWFFDPTPADHAEFPNIVDRFAATGSVAGTDLLGVLLHEMGHAMGIANQGLAIDSYLFELSCSDPLDNVNNPPTKLSAGFGFLGFIPMSKASGLHVFEQPVACDNFNLPGFPNDLMVRATPPSTRRLISDLDVQIIAGVYGINVVLPSTIAGLNYAASLNSATGQLTINGDLNGPANDNVILARQGNALAVHVNGAAPLLFPYSSLTSVVVALGQGSDSVEVAQSPGLPTPSDGNPLPAGVALNVTDNGPAVDNDVLSFAALGFVNYRVDGSQVVLNGSAAAYGATGVEQLTILALGAAGNGLRLDNTPVGVPRVSLYSGTGNDTIDIEQVGAGTAVDLAADSGADTVFLSLLSANLANIQGNLTLFGGSGDDRLYAYDQSSGAPVDYVLTDDTLQRGAQIFTHSDFEGLELRAGDAADTINVQSLAVATDIFAGLGGDEIRVDSNGSQPAGTVDGVKALLTVDGGLGAAVDLLTLYDVGDGTPDTVTVTDATVGATGGDTFFGAGGGVHYANVEFLLIDLGRAGDTIHITSTDPATTTVVNGTQGDDAFLVSSLDGPDGRVGNANGIRSQLTLWGSDGSDTLLLDDSTDATGDHATITATEVGAAAGDNFFGPGGRAFYDSFAELALHNGTDSDVVEVQATAAGTATGIDAGSGDDQIRIDSDGDASSAGTVDKIVSALTVNGQDGADALSLEDSGDATADTLTLTDTQLGAAATDTFFGVGGSLTYGSLATLAVAAGSGGDVLRIHATAPGTATTLAGADGDDQFAIDSNDALPGGSIDGVQSPLAIDGGPGFNALTLDDMNDATPDVLSISAVDLGAGPADTAFGPGGFVSYSQLASLTMTAGSGGNAIYLNATGAPLTLNAGFNADAVVVDSNGSAPGGTVDEIHHAVTLAGGGGLDQLLVDDSGSLAPKRVTVTENTIGAGAADVFFGSGGLLSYSGFVSIAVRTGSGDDNIAVSSAKPATSVEVNAGDGADSVTVSSQAGGGGTVDLVRGLLFVDGGPGNAVLSVDDAADATADTVHVAAAAPLAGIVGFDPADTFFGAGGKLSYDRVAVLSIGLGDVAGDSIFAVPSPTVVGTVLNFDGNNPTASPGDTLTVDLTGVADPVHTLGNPGAGSFTSSDHAPLEYAEIEDVQTLGAAPQVQLVGDAGDNVYLVQVDLARKMLQVFSESPPRHEALFAARLGAVAGLRIDSLAGDDQLIVEAPDAVTLPGVPIQFHAGLGSNSVRLVAGAALVDASADPGGVIDVRVAADATLIANRLRLDALALEDRTSRVRVNANGGPEGLAVLQRLSLAPGATLDLNDNDLVLHSSAAQRAAELARLHDLLHSGFSGGTWSGPGLASSVAAQDPRLLTALGVMLNDDGLGGAYRTAFSGEPVGPNDLLVKYTYYGDADLSGSVDGTDYALIDNGFNAGLTGWFNGDFDYSAATDGTDYALIDNAFNGQSGPLSGGAPAGLGPIPPAANQPAAVLAGQFDPAREFAPAAAEARDPFSTVALAGDLLDLLIAGSNRRRR